MLPPLDESLCDPPRRLHSSTQLLWKHRAGGEMSANARREIRTTMQALVRAAAERISAKFRLPEAPGTRGALGNRVIPAIDVEENLLFGAQTPRFSAVDMGHGIADRPNGVFR